ncbi:MAG: PPOX class F420-dependent oxidoreductase [Anaerolineales bacterium]|nr:PPOX class F420-dependent oxidoreductase [Anaerolineales bacterium]
MTAFESFYHRQYLNLETFRKSGVSVKTPVWFVQEGDKLFVRTVANSGKVKRIRNNARVNIAPCKVDGALLGNWLPALASEVKDQETERKVDRLLGKKYGLAKQMFSLVSALQRRAGTILEIKPGERS